MKLQAILQGTLTINGQVHQVAVEYPYRFVSEPIEALMGFVIDKTFHDRAVVRFDREDFELWVHAELGSVLEAVNEQGEVVFTGLLVLKPQVYDDLYPNLRLIFEKIS